ncbi:heavy-metal-associated domain-containing protein [Zobellella iuensis]|uniref:Heavy-metal-associated domain-containing protein n=1 Tax=Zobellella iuensis TaxID=2803811 RepID=A0ABS1QXK7_9GAMM|nr:heavy-metal-associated domain-containing protein [Zobellella iuensis]MBL1378888.1 heavy-metal-associated domain-containing protein [Zobellella iuensis]
MLTFTLPDMSCGHCTGAISRALKELDPGCVLEFDLAAHRLQVASAIGRDEVIEALVEAGYPPA